MPFMVGSIPNLLTLTRILLLPFFASAIIYEQYLYALILFITAALSDLLDGLAARMLHQITALGKILDPVADKFFLITSFILMSRTGLLPTWLAIVVISKDVIVVTGCIILYLVTGRLRIEVSILGKLSSAVQFILIGIILLSRNVNSKFNISETTFITVAIITGLAAIQYVYQGMKMSGSDSAA